ncbi:response regulator [Propionivibrio sp.]|uniref:response regulator n=1 Tax=Propionivibrio sp. TaxID=2212460 RepID=UPI003BF3EEE0
MDSEYTLFIVDDVEASRRMVESAFGQLYNVESFASGAACLERMAAKVPDLFLLDVDMPGMDGYALCRQIKSQPASSAVPVIFISALDDLESRLAGYDAGGDDFIVKPFKLAELKQKVVVLRRTGEGQSSLQQRLEDSHMLTSLVMSNLDEYAVLVNFLRSLNTCDGYREVADATLNMLKAFQLDGALQYRLPGLEMTINIDGEARPLEASIISLVRSLGTIATYRNRAAFNFDRVSVLVNNMPMADPELCGRIRDHLAIAVETVDAKLLAMLVHQESTQTKGGISTLLQTLGRTVRSFSDKYEQARFQGTETTRLMLGELDVQFAGLGMLESQEEIIKGIIQSRTDQLIDIFDFGAETEKTLNDLSVRLGQTLEPVGK